MCEYRRRGRHVILAGDLNISRRPEDVFWGYRMVHVPSFLAAGGLSGELLQIQRTLRSHWDGIKAMLASARPRPVTVRTTHQVRRLLAARGRRPRRWRRPTRSKHRQLPACTARLRRDQSLAHSTTALQTPRDPRTGPERARRPELSSFFPPLACRHPASMALTEHGRPGRRRLDRAELSRDP